MSILCVGVDIEDISRFQVLPYKKNEKFYKKVFTMKEIKYCLSKAKSAQHFTVRFCAKEATVKAVQKEIDLKDIEVIKENKIPKIKVKDFEKYKIHLSLSHNNNFGIAVVIIEK